MSRRKENIRKSCDSIRASVSDLIRLVSHSPEFKTYHTDSFNLILSKIVFESHRIKRTTWRNDENKLDNKITDEIIDIAMRSFKK
ncbi:MAG: hypothetical protein KBD25_05525 [Rickettsiaceae bacterium]|nr:hypothetical protein [Rickettsiaceae bacterium]